MRRALRLVNVRRLAVVEGEVSIGFEWDQSASRLRFDLPVGRDIGIPGDLPLELSPVTRP